MDVDLLLGGQLWERQHYSHPLQFTFPPTLTVRYLPSPTCSAVLVARPASRALLMDRLSWHDLSSTFCLPQRSSSCCRTSSAVRMLRWWMKFSWHHFCSRERNSQPAGHLSQSVHQTPRGSCGESGRYLVPPGCLMGVENGQESQVVSVRGAELELDSSCLVPVGGGSEEHRVH